MDWVVLFAFTSIGIFLAATRSSYLVDYAIVVYVFNRGIRRVLDWSEGAFNPLSPVSLTPLVVTGVMLLPALGQIKAMPRSQQRILYCLFAALGYAFVIGFIRINLGAVYALAEALAPIAVFAYVLVSHSDQPTRDRWLRTSAWCAVLVAAYGWYQYLTIPPWDAFWLKEAKMVGYMGIPKPMQMTCFSTMAERGVLGGFLGIAVIPMIIDRRWRTILGWPAVLLVGSGILLAQTRTGIIVAVFAVLIYVLINRGANFFQTILAMVVIGGVAFFGISRLPGSERIEQRFATLGNITEDGSFRGRLKIYQWGFGKVISNPIGDGLGATGLAGRVNTGSTSGQSTIMDAGFAELPIIYGWIGAGLIGFALWRIWQELAQRFRLGYRPPEVMLARAMLLTLVLMCFVGNVITQFSIMWIVFGSALNPSALRGFVLDRFGPDILKWQNEEVTTA